MQYLQQLRNHINRTLFNRACKDIRTTRPLSFKADPRVTVASMVGHATLDMYLVAVKSFMVFFGNARIEAIDDGSLTPEDRRLLESHLPGIEISDSAHVETGSCPSYSSWKRLFRIVEISQTSYVVQLDSDTITLGPMAEIFHRAMSNQGFLIGDGRFSEPLNLSQMQSIALRWKATGPQAFLEQILPDLQFFSPNDQYLHGCAGFAGYPQGSLSATRVEDLSREIETRIGRENWHRWGSEQSATLCLISKCPGAGILPWPKYRNHLFPATSEPLEAANFIHFIGTNRFSDDSYLRALRWFINHYAGLVA